MSYISSVQGALLDSSNYLSGQPSGSNWDVVKNQDGEAQDFNLGASGSYIYLYQESNDGDGVARFYVSAGDTKDPGTPSGWTVVKDQNGQSLDFNAGAGGKFIYLYYAKSSGEGSIDSLQAGYGGSLDSAMDAIPNDFSVLNTDLNEGSNGKYIYLGYVFNTTN